MNVQKRTSANTSINRNKLPAAFQRFRPWGAVLDYGCGKYIDHIRTYCENNGAREYFPFDPFNRTMDENAAASMIGEIHGYDTIFCCNVLNVIDSGDIIWNVIYTMFNWCKHYGRIIIQIYEGDRTGKGRETKDDCYQRNEKPLIMSAIWARVKALHLHTKSKITSLSLERGLEYANPCIFQ